jgi:AI-2 transport protein TqsA
VTGALVTITLLACSVKMAALFGLMSFLLNFIPNIGSMMAIVLPLPM